METNESTQTPKEVPSPIDTEKPSTSKFHELKYVIISVLILMVGVAGGIYYSRNISKAPNKENAQVTPTSSDSKSDEMEGWKTYTNEEYGFEFKHPSDWFSNKDSYKRINFFKANTTPLISEGGHQGNELLVIYGVESPLSLEKYGEEIIERTDTTDVFPQEIGNQSGFRYYDTYFGNNSYIVKTNNGFLTISFHKADYGIIYQILSTFEFVEFR